MLGPLEVQTERGWTGVSAPKWRTVLAVLLLNPGHVVSTDRLIEEVWPGEPPRTATNLVSIYVHRLRGLIGEAEGQILVTRAPGYQIMIAPEDLDTQRFAALTAEARNQLSGGDARRAAELLSQGLTLWRGSALADVPPSTLISAEAGRLEESRLEAQVLKMEADLACGEHAQVVPEARRLLADHPIREELWTLLLRAKWNQNSEESHHEHGLPANSRDSPGDTLKEVHRASPAGCSTRRTISAASVDTCACNPDFAFSLSNSISCLAA